MNYENPGVNRQTGFFWTKNLEKPRGNPANRNFDSVINSPEIASKPIRVRRPVSKQVPPGKGPMGSQGNGLLPSARTRRTHVQCLYRSLSRKLSMSKKTVKTEFWKPFSNRFLELPNTLLLSLNFLISDWNAQKLWVQVSTGVTERLRMNTWTDRYRYHTCISERVFLIIDFQNTRYFARKRWWRQRNRPVGDINWYNFRRQEFGGIWGVLRTISQSPVKHTNQQWKPNQMHTQLNIKTVTYGRTTGLLTRSPSHKASRKV